MKKLILCLLIVVSTEGFSGIINLPKPVGKSNSTQEKQAKAAQGLQTLANSLYLHMVSVAQSAYVQTWKNPLGLSPQEVFDSLGPNACQAHLQFLGLASMINGALPGSWTQKEDGQVSCNGDGTVSVKMPEPAPSPSPSPSPKPEPSPAPVVEPAPVAEPAPAAEPTP